MESINRKKKRNGFFLDTEEVGSSSLLEPTIAKDAGSSTSAGEATESASATGPILGPIDLGVSRARISEDWLKSIGFQWSQIERQPSRHWVLWLATARADHGEESGWAFSSFEDLGVEVAFDAGQRSSWFCWLRSDSCHRYHRFIHVRHLVFQDELVALIEALIGYKFDPNNAMYGSLQRPDYAKWYRLEDERRRARLDQQMLAKGHPWDEAEKDPDRARPCDRLREQVIKLGGAK